MDIVAEVGDWGRWHPDLTRVGMEIGVEVCGLDRNHAVFSKTAYKFRYGGMGTVYRLWAASLHLFTMV